MCRQASITFLEFGGGRGGGGGGGGKAVIIKRAVCPQVMLELPVCLLIALVMTSCRPDVHKVTHVQWHEQVISLPADLRKLA